MKTLAVRNIVFGDGMPKICIPITAYQKEELLSQLEVLLENPFDLVEWRADFYQDCTSPDWIIEPLTILREKLQDKVLLFTFRTKEEGGERSISMEEYERLCVLAASSHLADLVDIEINRGEERLQKLTEQIHRSGGYVVASYHDFHKTPDKDTLISVLTSMQSLQADISKAAVMPQTERDVLTLLDATLCMKEQYADRPYITMSMSRLGAVSRMAGGLTGSAVTFGTAGRASAPGQLEAEALSRLLPNL